MGSRGSPFAATFDLVRDDRRAIDRFWPKINKTDDCWLWTGGGRASRYGRFHLSMIGGRQPFIQPHRYSWMIANGPVPVGLEVCHSCDVPLCVRPDHLYLATHQQNLRDAGRKGRLSKPRVKKLSFADRAAIRELHRNGVAIRELARRYKVSRPSITFHLAAPHE